MKIWTFYDDYDDKEYVFVIIGFRPFIIEKNLIVVAIGAFLYLLVLATAVGVF